MYQVTNESTQHGENTPFGYSTPHRFPTGTGENLTDIFSGLARQLYPTGRAWWMQNNGVFDNLHKAINLSLVRFINDSDLALNSIFPDSNSFDENDAKLWEYRLGLVTNTLLSLEVRKQAILRKMAYPNNIKARQNPLFIENQLRLAGFDVYVHENKFFEGGEWVYKTPGDIISLSLTNSQHGGDYQHGGGFQHGSSNFDVIANESVRNESYSVGSNNLWATFFIGGGNLGDIASIPETRSIEFKELVLKLKPAHTVAFTFISYT